MMKKIFLLLISFVYVLSLAGEVFAFTPAQLQTLSNDSIYYRRCATPTSASTTTPGNVPAPVASGSSVFILGDSITVRTKADYLSVFSAANVTANVDGSTSRSILGAGQAGSGTNGNDLSGIDAVALPTDISQITAASAIVIALGTNGGNGVANVDLLIAAIKSHNSKAPIYWVDTVVVNRASYASTIEQSNAAIYQRAGPDGYTVISWFKTVEGASSNPLSTPLGNLPDPNSYIDNGDGLGVHPSAAGSTALSSLVGASVLGTSPSPAPTAPSGSSGVACCPSGSSNSTASTTTLSGSDNSQKAFNYFVSKGLSPMLAAAIVGNLIAESSVIPTQIEDPNGQTGDPSNIAGPGWGIAQWTEGRKVLGSATKGTLPLDVFGPAPTIAKGQTLSPPAQLDPATTPAQIETQLAQELDIVNYQLGTGGATGSFDLNTFKAKADIVSATDYFLTKFEGPLVDNNGVRSALAQGVLDAGSGTSTPAAPGSTSSCGSLTSSAANNSSPDCAGVTGNAKILCAAKVYDPISYVMGAGHGLAADWHKICPVVDASCSLDCSGLVNIAVFDATGVNLQENTNSEVADTVHWKQVSLSQVVPGDLIQPGQYNGQHVEIVDHVVGPTIYTFGAHTSNAPQPDQVGPSSGPTSPSDVYLHYIGTGL